MLLWDFAPCSTFEILNSCFYMESLDLVRKYNFPNYQKDRNYVPFSVSLDVSIPAIIFYVRHLFSQGTVVPGIVAQSAGVVCSWCLIQREI